VAVLLVWCAVASRSVLLAGATPPYASLINILDAVCQPGSVCVCVGGGGLEWLLLLLALIKQSDRWICSAWCPLSERCNESPGGYSGVQLCTVVQCSHELMTNIYILSWLLSEAPSSVCHSPSSSL